MDISGLHFLFNFFQEFFLSLFLNRLLLACIEIQEISLVYIRSQVYVQVGIFVGMSHPNIYKMPDSFAETQVTICIFVQLFLELSLTLLPHFFKQQIS